MDTKGLVRALGEEALLRYVSDPKTSAALQLETPCLSSWAHNASLGAVSLLLPGYLQSSAA